MKKILGFAAALLLLIPSLATAIDMSDVEFGGQVRMRGYALENMWSFNSDLDFDEWDVFRLKASLWTRVNLGDNVSAFIQLTDQTYGEGVVQFDAGRNALGERDVWEEDNKSNKIFLDNAYIDAKNVLGPISLRIGRQNLIYGSGFVILDGQSQFASTSIYFDGVKATMDITDNISLDAFYMKDQENTRSNLTEDDINLMGLYLTATGCPVIRGKQEFYVLNREDESLDKDIWMFGIRVSDKFDFGLDYSAEVAVQRGDAWEDRDDDVPGYTAGDQEALGYKLDLGYTIPIDLSPRVFGQYVFMSGDEADTDDWEGWDVFYGGWPQFGDLLAWVYVFGPAVVSDPAGSTIGEAAYTNLHIATIGAEFNIEDKLFPKFSYSRLQFDEDNAVYGLNDDDFGDYYQFSAKYKYSKMLSFAAYYAIIEPGDGVQDLAESDDNAQEFFWEAEVKF
ncbi:MAG: alginate export family protein [Desulfobacterales bacterium]